MKKFLIVWQESPETVKFFELEVGDEISSLLLSWNNQFINDYEIEPSIATAIHDFFYTEEGELQLEDVDLPLSNRTYDHIVTTGILL